MCWQSRATRSGSSAHFFHFRSSTSAGNVHATAFFSSHRSGFGQRSLNAVAAFEAFDDRSFDELLGAWEQALTTDEDWLRCAACGCAITRNSYRVDVIGAHQHRLTNPYGIRFDVGCFDQAPGCTEVGAPTDEATWFTPYEWRTALCVQCRRHLGWGFQAKPRRPFFALILNRLFTPS